MSLGSEYWDALTAHGEFMNAYYVVKKYDMELYTRVVAFASTIANESLTIKERAQIEAFIMAEIAQVLEDRI